MGFTLEEDQKRVWSYFGYFFKFSILSWVLRDYGAPLLRHIPALQHCDDVPEGSSSDVCYGKEAVFRLSLSLVIFFSICFGMAFKADSGGPRDFFDKHFFFLKYLGLLGLVFVCFTLPNESISDYAQAARVLGVLFLIFQSIQMLELFYKWNEWWVSKAEDHEGGWVPLLVSVTLSIYSASLVAVGLAYHYFSGCDFNVIVTTVTLAMGVLVTLLSVSKFRSESAGLLSAAFCFGYCVYLLWSAASSMPETCVQEVYPKANNDWTTIISLVFMVLVVSVCCLNSARDQEAFSLSSGDGDSVFSPAISHFVFVLSSAYMGMLLTGWDIDKHQGKGTFDIGWTSVWIKIAVQWGTALLYVWTLFAPFILESRSF
ncbi:serine incorporator protein [Chloropicon primus]|uniref:Serine incorporator protein n=1 Tax=Chloropicon primus TaxID=1764295 RepID=A0A5B8MYD9_9CHLO|nr:serine incorporator protein [Chloropicon primus]UPR03758.1 serine incorporator protein [Chloropicon primus]|eukprot:QDZ24550.1 serine incorporator protein [Chloropicon primus]